MLASHSYLLCSSFCVILFGLTTAVPQWHNSTDGSQYLIEGDQKYNWFHAFHECARRNLQMVEIDSQQKNQALIQVLKPIFGNSHNIWIGANDEYNRDKNYNRPFYWSSSGKPLTFTYWSNDNPDNYKHDEHCAHMWADKPEYRWNDIRCDSPRFAYICEDHYQHVSQNQAMTEKHKKATETTAKLFEAYHQLEKQQIEKLESSLIEIENGETELKEFLHNIHTKLEFDINHALAQHQREVNSVIDDTNKAINNLIMQQRNASEISKGEEDLKELMQKIHTKLEYDVTHALTQHQREANSVVDDKSRVIRHLNMDLRSTSEVATKKFTKELESAKSAFNDILSN